MLILFMRNSWDESYHYPAAPPVDKEGHLSEEVVVERPIPAPPVPEKEPEQHQPAPEPEPAESTYEKLDGNIAEHEEDDTGIEKPIKETSKEETSLPEIDLTKGQSADEAAIAEDGEVAAPKYAETTEPALDIHSQNPPHNIADEIVLGKPKDHWRPVPEHFPLAEEDIARLPTGTPKKIPKIQYDFGTESEEGQITRLQRLKRVKQEIERSWGGYKKFAWMHDELSPMSAKYRDPFCGWAATLVDSLDTLWIAGLKDDFDEAAKAVKEIDFTFTERNEIPVFETTIRYLGGLLAAFDVSGGEAGKHGFLLGKAEELAEILMGIFDTPNRMPVLYYNWRSVYASQPHRATRVGIAELATLSLEFTRLAQLTGKHKYYDAINRITDALVEMQKSHPQIPGLFPEGIDASGCNKTATTLRDALSRAAQNQLDEVGTAKEPVGYVPESASFSGESEDEDTVARQLRRRDVTDWELEDDDVVRILPATVTKGEISAATPTPKLTEAIDDDENVKRIDIEEPPLSANGRTTKWDCVPQGLVPSGYGYSDFHMGGGQDSAYEYFPKEWLLLGGLEPKYQKLYEDSVEAINEWLLYRPMAAEDWDVLFTAKVSLSSGPGEEYTPKYEIAHLTCFIGGMYGLGGKIFGREQDVEMAKKLTDGCVWAYQTMPSGLMPESAHVAPCPTLEKCEFNETKWWESLDPSKAWRDQAVARWEANEGKGDQAPLSESSVDELTGLEVEGSESRWADETPDGADSEALNNAMESAALRDSKLEGLSSDDDLSAMSSSSFTKRAAIPVEEKKSASSDDDVGSELPDSLKEKLGMKVEEKPKPTDGDSTLGSSDSLIFDSSAEPESGVVTGGDAEEDDSPPTIPLTSRPDQMSTNAEKHKAEKPQSHEEYVKEKIEIMGLPPGYTDIPGRSYILRPEAIESVWYMYRITGDPEWMDKGWRMFEATVRSTRTQFANSAVDDVTVAEPGLKDEMESFWLAETLKYYFLLFSEPDVISLDEWVLNTEAHPFKRPT